MVGARLGYGETRVSEQRRYSAEQVLDILHAWHTSAEGGELGRDEFPALRLVDLIALELLAGREWAYSQFFAGMADRFQFSVCDDEWQPLAQENATMGDVAEFIAARAPCREIGPATVLGRWCLEAGVFRELELSTEWIAGPDVRVGPSTLLNAVLKKKQRERLADRLRLLYRGLDQSPALWRTSVLETATFVCLGLLGVCALGSLLVGLKWMGFVVLGACCGLVGLYLLPVIVLLFIVAGLAGIGKGPFHRDIKTYRDLVEALKIAAPWSRAR